MHAGCPGTNHALHEFERVEIAAEASFRVGNDRCVPVNARITLQRVNLVGTLQRIVDSLHHFRHRVDRVQALVRVHFARTVAVARNLPARAVNRLEARLHFLNRLITRQGAQAAQGLFLVHETPEFIGAISRQSVLNLDCAT